MCDVNNQFELLEFVLIQYDEIYLTFTAGSVCLCGVCCPVVVIGLYVKLSWYPMHLHHTLAALKRYFPASLVITLPNLEQINLPSSNHTNTKSTQKHIHHHYATSVTSTHMTHSISSTTPAYAPHCHPWICGQTPLG